MLVSLLRWMKGYLQIRIIGYSPERFFNLCNNKGIDVWNVSPFKDNYDFYLSLKEFYKIKPICRKTGVKARILHRIGLPFVLEKFRKRKAFCIGFMWFIFFIFLTNLFIWDIDITGNFKTTDDVILSYLKENHVQRGTAKNNIVYETIKSNLRKNFDEIVWASVSLDGTVLKIELKEKAEVEENSQQIQEGSHIVSHKSGTITEIITRKGTPIVTVGDTVMPGDILVSGIIEVLNDNKEIVSKKYINADADIWAETIVEYNDEIVSSHKTKKYSEKENYLYKVQWMDKLFTLGYQSKAKSLIEEHSKELQSPLRTYIIHQRAYEWSFDYYSLSERETILKERFHNYCKNLYIIDGNLNITHYANKSIASCTLKILEKIGESRKIIDLSSENMVQ